MIIYLIGAISNDDDRPEQPCQNNSFWGTTDWLYCRDGKWRPVESGTFPLADGVPGRVGLLRGYGNAIVPQVAAEFIRAFMEASR
jgi:DNA (cytosine-5)-methyltransferase 1